MRKSKRRKVKHALSTKPMPARKRAFHGLDNTKDLDVILGRTKLFQDVLGLTRENVSSLYEQAMELLQLNRIDDASRAFSLLTKMNPYIADFWNGLGVSHLLHEEHKEAFDAFLMALTMDPSLYETYAYAIECCVQMKNFSQAEALLQQAISYAKRHPAHEESAIILEEASHLQQLIDAEKPA